MKHAFHIPVLGLAFSIDSPLKVAKFGIASVMSIVDDELIERMRQYYAQENQLPFSPITKHDIDHRAHRITAYLNLVQVLVNKQITTLREEEFAADSDLTKYFELLPESDSTKKMYLHMLATDDLAEKTSLQEQLRQMVLPGDIDVNIMSKVDKLNERTDGTLLDEKHADALAALRGFAESDLHSSVILSAGMNPRLYSYLAELPAFFPNQKGILSKKITLKVSDFRSAYIQAKFLAKKGIWVSEFRVESGLNCGGHAFATDGYLLGPILEEFKQRKAELIGELHTIYQSALKQKGIEEFSSFPIKFSVQGGIGTAEEQTFLLEHYGFDSAGWGSPFLLVPEATTVDDETLNALTTADPDDFYLSNSSPLGVLFNNFRKSSAEKKRLERIAKGHPGSPCTKKYLISNTDYSERPICTASRLYQHTKIKELENEALPNAEFEKRLAQIVEKTCLCEGLSSAAYLKYNIAKPKENTAVAICPGPNTIFFKHIYSLKEMVDHIYGRVPFNLANRPNLFINELQLYVNYLKKNILTTTIDTKKIKFIQKFKNELLTGIDYYRSLSKQMASAGFANMQNFLSNLNNYEQQLALVDTDRGQTI